MGNQTSSQVSFRSIINEIKYGSDLGLVDPTEASYTYEASGLLANHAKSGTTVYQDTPTESANMRAYFAGDRPVYKIIFTTVLSDADMAAFFNHDDVRFLRRYRPNQLAHILYKCMEQLHYFIKHSTQLSDTTAAVNAIRILGNSIPYLLEDLSLKVSEPEPVDYSSQEFVRADAVWRQNGGYGKSVFADDFFFNFFWRNLACTGESFYDATVHKTMPLNCAAEPQRERLEIYANCPQLPPIDSKGGRRPPPHAAGGSSPAGIGAGVPFAHVLVRLLTDCCFVPYFTVNGVQNLSAHLDKISGGLSAVAGGSAAAGGIGGSSFASSSSAAASMFYSIPPPQSTDAATVINSLLPYPSHKAREYNARLFVMGAQNRGVGLPPPTPASAAGNNTNSDCDADELLSATTTNATALLTIPNLFVSSPLLWYDGAFVISDDDRANMRLSKLTNGSSITYNRMTVLRTLLALFIERVAEGHVPVSENTRRWRGVSDGDHGNNGEYDEERFIPRNTKADVMRAHHLARHQQQGHHHHNHHGDHHHDHEMAKPCPIAFCATPGSPEDTFFATDVSVKPLHLPSYTVAPYLSDIFSDPQINPLGATLCASLFNYVAAYESKGVLPFTSYIGAEASEALLALSGQALNAFLDFDVRTGDGGCRDGMFVAKNSPAGGALPPTPKLSGVPYLRRPNTSPQNIHSMWAVVDAICSGPIAVVDPAAAAAAASSDGGGVSAADLLRVNPLTGKLEPNTDLVTSDCYTPIHQPRGGDPMLAVTALAPVTGAYRSQLAKAVLDIIANPFYAMHRTRIGGSQRRVLCYLEYLHLLVRLFMGGAVGEEGRKSPLSAAAGENNANNNSGSPTTTTTIMRGNLLMEEYASDELAPRLTEALLFFIYNGTLHHKFFSEVQVVLLLLRMLVEGDGVPIPSSSSSPASGASSSSNAAITSTTNAAAADSSTTMLPSTASCSAAPREHLFINRGNSSYVRNFLMRSRAPTSSSSSSSSSSSYTIQPSRIGLPPIPLKHSINADLVVLCMCSMLSEATPRWYLGLVPSAASVMHQISGIIATIAEEREAWEEQQAQAQAQAQGAGGGDVEMSAAAASQQKKKRKGGLFSSSSSAHHRSMRTTANSSPYDHMGTLSGITLYEMRHSFDFTTQRNFLRKGDMCFQAAQLMLEAVVLLLSGGKGLASVEGVVAKAVNAYEEKGGVSSTSASLHPLAAVDASAIPASLLSSSSSSSSCLVSFPSHSYLEAIASLAASVGTSEAVCNLLEYWYGIRVRHSGGSGGGGSATSGSGSGGGVSIPSRDNNNTNANNNHRNYRKSVAIDMFNVGILQKLAADKAAGVRDEAALQLPTISSGSSSSKKNMDGGGGAAAFPSLGDELNCVNDGEEEAANAKSSGGDLIDARHSVIITSSASSSSSLLPAALQAHLLESELRLPIRTQLQMSVVLDSFDMLQSLYVVVEKVLRHSIESAILSSSNNSNTNNNNTSSSTAGRNEVTIDGRSMQVAFSTAVSALEKAYRCGDDDDDECNDDGQHAAGTKDAAANANGNDLEKRESYVYKYVDPNAHLFDMVDAAAGHQPYVPPSAAENRRANASSSPSTNSSRNAPPPPPRPFANLLSSPVAQWLSKACWVTTQMHTMGMGKSAVLFDARSCYMFIGTRRVYGDDVKEKIARGKVAVPQPNGAAVTASNSSGVGDDEDGQGQVKA